MSFIHTRYSARSHSRQVIWVALLADIAITTMKFGAAALSGSSAMYSEALHSLADSANQILLLVGRTLSRQPADSQHPFGYGKERFFWPFIVSLVIFSLGGVFSIIRGLRQIQMPRPLSHPNWNFLILGVSFCLDATSWVVAHRELKRSSPGKPLWKAIRESKAPSIIAVFLEDTAGLIGIGIAGFAILLVQTVHIWAIDGIASFSIGILLFIVAFIMASETKSLLIGEAASKEEVECIRRVISSNPKVERIVRLLTMHLGPDEILVNLDLQFKNGLKTEEIEEAVDTIEREIRNAVPSASRIFIEVESARSYDAT